MSEIRIMSFNFAPQGWAQCNGQLMPINQNQALFSLLGTAYGGNGTTNFALPDLRGMTPIHFGKHALGEKGGEQAHTLSVPEMPAHTHTLSGASDNADQPTVPNNLFGAAAGLYGPPNNLTKLIPTTITNFGGSQAHMNMQPFLTLEFCISLTGVFPSHN